MQYRSLARMKLACAAQNYMQQKIIRRKLDSVALAYLHLTII